ncbi:MAG: hypothetical protein R3C60_11240 [Parvularculaceae bacterium]
MHLDMQGRRAIVIEAHARPYSDPVSVRVGEIVVPDLSMKTDVTGWIWCRGPDGREGWTPAAWIDQSLDPWRMLRDFNAIELDLAIGDELTLSFSESGFVWARTKDGREGWAPDGALELIG